MIAADVLRHMGPRRAAWRIIYEAERRIGWMRWRYPARDLSYWSISHVDATIERLRTGQLFFVPASNEASLAAYREQFADQSSRVIEAANRVTSGQMSYFSHQWHDFGGPPAWFLNPFTRQVVPDRHWSRLSFHAQEYGDLKVMLEPARFNIAYLLVRAYWLTGDDSYPAAFWRLVEDWARHNPPQAGPLWICGQESAIRVMAWCFALYGLVSSPQSTPDRVACLMRLIAAHGDRINGTLGYARSQKNNHAISEAVGLWTIGLLFPELPQSSQWKDRGRRLLVEAVSEQIYNDGSYVQHSLNYHRMMLQLLTWALRLGETAGEPLPSDVYRRFDLANCFLFELMDLESGCVPNHGANDGALILPLNRCEYPDMRPVFAAGHYLIHHYRILPPGPWDEDLFWLFGPSLLSVDEEETNGPRATAAVTQRAVASFPDGGYFVLRSPKSWAVVRCARYRDRPSHADLLHVDIWWRGINVALDPGTFSYNSPAPWDSGLASTACHNTLTIDGRDQMDKVGRFLWLPWARGTVRSEVTSDGGSLAYWEGEHDGYHRLPVPATHRRGILRIGDDHWIILDESRSEGLHDHHLQWLLPDLPYQVDDVVHSGKAQQNSVTVATPAGDYTVSVGSFNAPGQFTFVRADADTTRGWRSAYYLDRASALSMALDVRAANVRLWTFFGPPGSAVEVAEDGLHVSMGATTLRIALGQTVTAPLVKSVVMTGKTSDQLQVTR